MPRKLFITLVVLLVVGVALVMANGDRLYEWLLRMHGGGGHR